MEEKYFTYVLRSLKDRKLYIGCTQDLEKRIERHNRGYERSTKFRRPLELVYYEVFYTRQEAIDQEKYFKTGLGRKFLKTRIF